MKLPTTIVIALLLAPAPATAQSRLYNNADLGHRLSPETVRLKPDTAIRHLARSHRRDRAVVRRGPSTGGGLDRGTVDRLESDAESDGAVVRRLWPLLRLRVRPAVRGRLVRRRGLHAPSSTRSRCPADAGDAARVLPLGRL